MAERCGNVDPRASRAFYRIIVRLSGEGGKNSKFQAPNSKQMQQSKQRRNPDNSGAEPQKIAKLAQGTPAFLYST